MSRFMEFKSNNPKLGQDQIVKELSFSDSTLERYRNDIKVQSLYKWNAFKRTQKTSDDLKRLQKTELYKPVWN